jgi:hypothetical protein
MPRGDYQSGLDCERCDTSELVQVNSILSDVYHARICLRCCNEWEVFITNHDLYREKNHALDRLTMIFAMSQGDGKDRILDVAQLRKTLLDLDARIFAVTKQWIKEA